MLYFWRKLPARLLHFDELAVGGDERSWRRQSLRLYPHRHDIHRERRSAQLLAGPVGQKALFR